MAFQLWRRCDSIFRLFTTSKATRNFYGRIKQSR